MNTAIGAFSVVGGAARVRYLAYQYTRWRLRCQSPERSDKHNEYGCPQ